MQIFDTNILDKDIQTITLCGSSKFKEEFEELNKLLTMSGYCVFTMAFFVHYDNIILKDYQKDILDIVHKKKIDKSEAIIVVNKNNYIGSSTSSEIEYAKENNKYIYYLY